MTDRELDTLVAEKVMGVDLSPVEHKAWDGRLSFVPGAIAWCTDWTESPEPEPFSTSIEAAWEVVEKLTMHSIQIRINKHDASDITWWEVYIHRDFTGEEYRAYADTASRAICLAALKAVGVEV